jgi:O-antigen/teichoic acid export membrane protein
VIGADLASAERSEGEAPLSPAPADKPAASEDVAHAARSGALQILAVLSQSLMVVAHVVMARLFGPLVFGTYQTGAAVVEMLTRGGTGGADKGMLRYVAAYRAAGRPEEAERAVGTGVRLAWLIAGLLATGAVAIALLGGPAVVGPGLAAALPIMAPAAIFSATTLVLVQASLAARATRANLIVRGLGEPTLVLLAAIVAWSLGGGLRGVAVAHLTAAFLTATLAFTIVGAVFGARRLVRAVRAPGLRGFAPFTLPIGAADMLNAVLQRADVVILTRYVGGEAAAFYVAGEFITRAIANVRYAFDSIAAGVLSEALHLGDRARVRYNLRLMTRWVITATLPIAGTVIALRSDLLALYGPSFQRAGTALVVLAAAQVVSGCFGLTGWVLTVSGRSRALLWINLAGAVLNVSLGLVLIPRMGLVGGAITALVTVAALIVMMYVVIWSAERVHPFDVRQLKPVLAAAAAFAAQILLPRLHPTALRVAAVVGCGLAVDVLILVVLGLPAEEKALGRRIWQRLRGSA